MWLRDVQNIIVNILFPPRIIYSQKYVCKFGWFNKLHTAFTSSTTISSPSHINSLKFGLYDRKQEMPKKKKKSLFISW